MTECPLCKEALNIKTLACPGCKTEYSGSFLFPRLARLSKEERDLSESLIVHGGNLKEMAQSMDISYPTLKKRLNALSLSLQALQKSDESDIDRILNAMEDGSILPKEGIKMIREINGEL